MKIVDKFISNNGKFIKFLQKTEDNLVTETAFIEENDRYIICFASQLGCQVGCKICYNGIYKNYYRNLTVEEIVKECSNVANVLELNSKPICFSCMGVGEPLLNYKNVVEAIKKLDNLYPNSFFALATTGLKYNLISQLANDLKNIENFKLTISLHAYSDNLRKMIIPIDMSLFEIKKQVEQFKLLSHHSFEWNYVLLDGINDSKKDAIRLANFIDRDEFLKISSFNNIEGCDFKKSTNSEEFMKILKDKNINFKTFDSEGTDIEIGCGQMLTHYNKIKILKKEEK